MKKKTSKIKARGRAKRCPPKAKVGRSNRLGSATLSLPGEGQLTEIPKGYEVIAGIACEDFVHRPTLLLRKSDSNLFENDLKSRRSVGMRARSA